MTRTINTIENVIKYSKEIMKVKSRVKREYAEYLAECFLNECYTHEEMRHKIKTEA